VEGFLDLLIYVGTFVVLIGLGFFVGGARERSHYKDLEERTAALRDITLTDIKALPPGFRGSGGQLVMGEAVIASDYLKTFLLGIRNFFGGEATSVARLVERAREEAKLRMLEQARSLGSNLVINVRFETSSVAELTGGQGVPSAEVFCYGTAIFAE